MSDPIELTEYEPWTGDLPQADCEFLAALVGSKLSVRRAVAGGQILINPKQFVGLLTLPSGTRVRISPKIPAPNLFRMLATSYELPTPFLDEAVETASLDDLLEFVADYFVAQLQHRIDRGLYREYVDREENLPVVRGRISFAEDIRANFALRHRTYCRFAELTWDVPHNQVLRQVAVMLAGWGFSARTTSRLGQIISVLDEVSTGRLTSDQVGAFQYHRLNEDYWELHQLCRLFLDFSSPNEEFGPIPLRSFLIDMNDLFERFVAQQFKDILRPPWALRYQSQWWLAEGDRVLLKPDLVIWRRGQGVAAVDCKYKRLGSDEYKNHDLYQLLAYCTAIGLNTGTLVYPRHRLDINEDIEIKHSDICLSQMSIDLSGAWSAVLEETARIGWRIVQTVVDQGFDAQRSA